MSDKFQSNRTLLKVENLRKYFAIHRGLLRRVVGRLCAVDGVSMTLREGETLGLVGESGCGKTTTGRCILRLTEPTSGSVVLNTHGNQKELTTAGSRELKEIRREAQMIFQDPISSLDPRLTVRNIVAEPLIVHRMGSRSEQTELVNVALEKVRLSPDIINRYPHEFSGGQRQRIGLARALVIKPKLLVCDEPVSALDVSVQAQILNLLADLKEEMGLSLIFIAHDLSVVEHISDRVMVMYLGRIVESATTDDLYIHPKHPYTEALLSAVPKPDPRSKAKRIVLEGAIPDASAVPEGCRFHTRCAYVKQVCKEVEPPLEATDPSQAHYAACHRAGELSLNGFGRGTQPGWLES